MYITKVAKGSDAAAKGIEDGDLLLSINGTPITTMEELKSTIYQYEVGQTVETVIYRAGQQYLVELTLTEDRG